MVGAVLGGLAGYLFFTDRGRELRRQLEPALDDFCARAQPASGRPFSRTAGVASEGWKLLNEAIGEACAAALALCEPASDHLRSEVHAWQANLDTTNLLLGIMAAVSVLEALLLIGMGVAGFMVYRRVMDLVERHRKAADGAGDGARQRDSRRREGCDRDGARKRPTGSITRFTATIDRVDDTADRVRSNVRAKTSRVVGLVRGAAGRDRNDAGHRRRGTSRTAGHSGQSEPGIDETEAPWQTDTIASTTRAAAAAAS